jgi:kinesin family protein 3/17
MIRCSFLQIYNESISDLLRPENKDLRVREKVNKGLFVENLSEWVATDPDEIKKLI